MIEKNKFRKKRPRPSSRKSPNFRQLNGQNHSFAKSKGNISKVLEKYMNMAQEAHSNGDRIVAENFYQYAEHYQRLLNENEKKDNLKDSENLADNNHKNSGIEEIKLSRTQRAMNAKDEKFHRQKNAEEKDREYTSDGIEALKPFQKSVIDNKSQPS